jgi:hypothetical protein
MSRNKKSSSAEQKQFWQMAIETWRASGLPVRQFCRQEGLTEPAFYSWRRKLTGSDSGMNSKSCGVSSAFIEVALPGHNSFGLELVLSSGNTLRIGSSADNKTLSNVLSVLRETGLC